MIGSPSNKKYMNYKEYNSWLNRKRMTQAKKDYNELDNGAMELFLSVVAGILIFISAYLILFI